MLAKDVQVVENCLSPGSKGYAPSLSDRLCRASLWSEVVVRLVLREQERRQVTVDSEASTPIIDRYARIAAVQARAGHGPGCIVLTVSIDQWGTLVTGLSGFAFLLATIVALVIRKWRVARYLATTTYVLYFPIHLWFWQFELTQRAPLPGWYFGNAVQNIALGGLIPLIWFSLRRRFRPVVTALFLLYVLSLLLQFFSYMYWTYGTTENFTIRMTHLDSFYFALGTLTTAGTGNLSAVSETTRNLQTWQMGLDLLLVGFVIALVLARYANLFNPPVTRPSADNRMVPKPRPDPGRSARQETGTGWPSEE